MWGQQGQKICDYKIMFLILYAIITGEEAFCKQLRKIKKGEKKNTSQIHHEGATVKLLFRIFGLVMLFWIFLMFYPQFSFWN